MKRKPSRHKVRRIFKFVDADKNGVVDFAESAAAMN
jgi:Ca2+-binding EF-hand superfamily protein